MTKDRRLPIDCGERLHLSFDIRHSLVIRHWEFVILSLVIRHWEFVILSLVILAAISLWRMASKRRL
jgi:hypothetical protein